MKCKNCNTENILKADYCKGCGSKFTQQEKDAAYDKTIFAKIDKVSDIWSKLKLEHITGSRWFKIISLAGLAVYCVIVMMINGTHMRILDSNEYSVNYNNETNEYYLISDREQVWLELYLPAGEDSVEVMAVDEQSALLNSCVYEKGNDIVLEYSEEYHYILKTEKESVELYIVTIQ